MTLPIFLSQSREGIILRVHCQPRAKKVEVVGPFGESLKIRLKSPPVDGKANREAQALLAKVFNLPKRDIVLLRGETSREKAFLLKDLKKDECLKRLSELGVI